MSKLGEDQSHEPGVAQFIRNSFGRAWSQPVTRPTFKSTLKSVGNTEGENSPNWGRICPMSQVWLNPFGTVSVEHGPSLSLVLVLSPL